MDNQEQEPGKPASSQDGAQARRVQVTILTELPDTLPVLSSEVALIRSYLGELVARIATNDNGDDR
jgi:hypothetical protein